MASVTASEPMSNASNFYLLLGIITGLLVYCITSVAAWDVSFISGLGIIPILSREFDLFPLVVLALLSNILPVALFFLCRRKKTFLAFGLLGGSFAGSVLHLIYIVSAWQEAIATAPRIG